MFHGISHLLLVLKVWQILSLIVKIVKTILVTEFAPRKPNNKNVPKYRP